MHCNPSPKGDAQTSNLFSLERDSDSGFNIQPRIYNSSQVCIQCVYRVWMGVYMGKVEGCPCSSAIAGMPVRFPAISLNSAETAGNALLFPIFDRTGAFQDDGMGIECIKRVIF